MLWSPSLSILVLTLCSLSRTEHALSRGWPEAECSPERSAIRTLNKMHPALRHLDRVIVSVSAWKFAWTGQAFGGRWLRWSIASAHFHTTDPWAKTWPVNILFWNAPSSFLALSNSPFNAWRLLLFHLNYSLGLGTAQSDCAMAFPILVGDSKEDSSDTAASEI